MGKIYTKSGDHGETGLLGGQRVRKSDQRVGAYGSIDELNAVVGVARVAAEKTELNDLLVRIQNDLFNLGADLAIPSEGRPEERERSVSQGDISCLEETIDRYDAKLPSLRKFVLPGGCELAARLHNARAVCRRAEREVVHLSESVLVDGEVIVYLNRLSDLFFVLARWANFKKKVRDLPWKKSGES